MKGNENPSLIKELIKQIAQCQKSPCQGKYREFGHFVKAQGKEGKFCLLKL